MAMSVAAIVATIQPMIVTDPMLARVAGSRKMPDPIMLLATSTVARKTPIFRFRVIQRFPTWIAFDRETFCLVGSIEASNGTQR
jgi:hypothetical protein